MAAALEGNAELMVYRSTVDSARISLVNARHARLPELAVTGAFGMYGYDEDFTAAVSEMASGDLPYWSVGGELSVPLGNRAARGEPIVPLAPGETVTQVVGAPAGNWV